MANLCIFCYKTIPINSTIPECIEGEVKKNSDGVVKSFMKLVGRYLGNIGESKLENKWLSCCADCEIIIGSFCQLYQELNLLEIQLEWKLNTLVNVMKLANRVPSRMKQLKCVFEQDAVEQQELKNFKGFRSNLIKKCARKLSNSQPRVFLGGRNDDCNSSAKSTRNPPFLESFLGWIMSFSAVALLATTTAPTLNQHYLLSEGIPIAIGLDAGQVENTSLEAESRESLQEANNEQEHFAKETQESLRNDAVVGYQRKPEVHLEEDTCPTAVLPKIEQGIENDEDYFTSHGPISDNDPFEDCENDFQEDDIVSTRETLPTDGPIGVPGLRKTEKNENPQEATEIRQVQVSIKRERCFTCKICSKQYKYKHGLERHVRIQHSTPDSIDENKYICKMCNFVCKSYGALLVHKTSTSHQNQKKHPLSKRDEIPDNSNATKTQHENLTESDTNSSNLNVMNVEENQLQGPTTLRYNLREKRKRSYKQAEMDEETQDEIIDNSGNSDREFFNADDSSSSSSDSDTSIKCNIEEVKFDKAKKKQVTCGLDGDASKSHKEELFEQRRKLNASSNYKCDVKDCKASFKTRLLLNYHMGQEHKVLTNTKGKWITVRCEICNLRISGFRKQEIHFREYHDTEGMSVDKILKCEVENCSAYFKTSSQRYIHMSKEHIVTVKSLETLGKHHGNFKCNFCSVVKENATDLAIHEMEHAMREVSSAKTSKLKKFNCARCPHSSVFKKRYVTHYLIKHLNLSPEKSKTCPICSAEGKNDRFHKNHFQIQHNTEGMDPKEIQRCDQCQAYFIKSDQLIMHKYAVHYKRKCPVCGKIFARRPHKFRFHMDQQHPLFNAFPHLKYSCDIKGCANRFGTERELNHHKNHERHYDDELMKCSQCGKEYKGEKKLRAHMYHSHANQTHICSECGKTFTTKHSLQTHLKYHKAPEDWNFQCSTCGKKCVDKYKLTEHQRTHSKEKPFVCQVCGEKYAHRHNWMGHMRTKHDAEFNELINSRTEFGSRTSEKYVSRKGSKKGQCIIAGVNQV